MLTTPVAFIIFNRPDLTARVFEAIRQAQPRQLLVIADGPRHEGDVEKCRQTRAVIEAVDWDCEVLTNFSEQNLGSVIRCSSGIDWVFSQVEEAIILEDDCLPTPSFFHFCQTLLEHYRHDERVMHISGNNFQYGQSRTEASYYFSKYTHTWGWATWKRAWRTFDLYLENWDTFQQQGALKSICDDPVEYQYWANIFERVASKQAVHWDYAWLFHCWSNHGLAILPDVNLISNIGFREDATRTKGNHPSANLPTLDSWNIQHPSMLAHHHLADRYTFDHHFGGIGLRRSQSFNAKLRRTLGKPKRVAKSLLRSLVSRKEVAYARE
jgi:hypothetical protein